MMAMEGKRPSSLNDYSIRDQCNMLHQKLSGAISSFVLSDASTIKNENKEDPVYSSNSKVAAWLHISRPRMKILLFFSILTIGLFLLLRAHNRRFFLTSLMIVNLCVHIFDILVIFVDIVMVNLQ